MTQTTQTTLTNLRRDIAATIRAGRARLEVSQRELAALTGYSQSVIARLEAETSDPRMSCLITVLAAVGARLVLPDPAQPRRMAGDHVRDEAGRRLPAHLKPYRLSMPHDWWRGTTQIRMWPYGPKWSYWRRPFIGDDWVPPRLRARPTVRPRPNES